MKKKKILKKKVKKGKGLKEVNPKNVVNNGLTYDDYDDGSNPPGTPPPPPGPVKG